MTYASIIAALAIYSLYTLSSSALVGVEAFPQLAAGDACSIVQSSADSFVANLNVVDGCGQIFAKNKAGASSNLAALWLRALFHDGGSWDEGKFEFGIDGSIINEITDAEADGLAAALPIIASGTSVVMNPFFNVLVPSSPATPADTLSISAMAAVSHCGGPTIPVSVGASTQGVVPDDGVQAGLIPSDITLSSDALFKEFSRMGFVSKVDMFTLVTGSHTLGGAHRVITPNAVFPAGQDFAPFDSTPTVFDNQIFVELFADPTKCVLPIDCHMAQDPELASTLKLFAQDKNQFFAAYTKSMTQFLGFTTSRFALVPSGGCPFNVAKHDYTKDTNGTVTSTTTSSSSRSSTSTSTSSTSTASSTSSSSSTTSSFTSSSSTTSSTTDSSTSTSSSSSTSPSSSSTYSSSSSSSSSTSPSSSSTYSSTSSTSGSSSSCSSLSTTVISSSSSCSSTTTSSSPSYSPSTSSTYTPTYSPSSSSTKNGQSSTTTKSTTYSPTTTSLLYSGGISSRTSSFLFLSVAFLLSFYLLN